jgi:hypothetical protein
MDEQVFQIAKQLIFSAFIRFTNGAEAYNPRIQSRAEFFLRKD